MNIYIGAIYYSPKVETTYMPMYRSMGKQNVVYPYGGILLTNKKE